MQYNTTCGTLKIIPRVHFQVHVVEQDFKSLYLGSKHDLTNSASAATSSSLSKESVAEVDEEQEMLLTLGPSSKASKKPMCITIVLEMLLVLLHGLHGLPGGL